MKLWEKVLNGTLIFICVGSISWFVFNEHEKFHIEPYDIPKEIIQEPNKINWETLIPGMFSIGGILLKYYLDEKKKKNESKKIFLKDHLVFDTIEDLLENQLRHKNFGSEGRTEMMRSVLSIQLDTYRTALQEFIMDNPRFEDFNDFRKKLRACIFKMVDSTEDRWNDRQIPKIIIEKYSLLYRQRIELLISDVTTVSLTHSNTLDALNVFLNEARIVFITSLQDDVITTLRSLNGELSGLTFNGKNL